METCQQRFEQYLILNHKEDIEKLIRQRIEEAKNEPYYAAEESPVPYDSSLRLYKTDDTIGDRCKEDFLVLNAYTGDQRATYLSGYGLCSVTVGDKIEEELSEKIDEWAYDFISDNFDVVCQELSEETEIEDNTSLEDLAFASILEYGIITTMFSLLEIIDHQTGIIKTLKDRQDLYDDYLEYELADD